MLVAAGPVNVRRAAAWRLRRRWRAACRSAAAAAAAAGAAAAVRRATGRLWRVPRARRALPDDLRPRARVQVSVWRIYNDNGAGFVGLGCFFFLKKMQETLSSTDVMRL